ncbi:hypothetical protein [Streptomyces sp. NPDC002566]|uniref:hypothetical protein n=1 Tax=Streptomyces sp. NPDC002566 TaxID=3364650 RepID=UPI003682C4A6
MQRPAAVEPLLLMDAEPPDWQRPCLADARTANLLDPPQVLHDGRKLASARSSAGMLNFHAAHVRAAALLRQELALPGPPTATTETTILRHRTAQLLTGAGVDQAFSAATAATWPGTGTVIEPLLDGAEVVDDQELLSGVGIGRQHLGGAGLARRRPAIAIRTSTGEEADDDWRDRWCGPDTGTMEPLEVIMGWVWHCLKPSVSLSAEKTSPRDTRVFTPIR